jgi:putative sporulation protein YyaC
VETLVELEPLRVRCSHQEPSSVQRLSAAIVEIQRRARGSGPLVVVCIGTDRSTGDALGPITGCELLARGYPDRLVYGTLDEPVHAGNLRAAVAGIEGAYPRASILAVDACLGTPENVGSISLAEGPVRPGAGVNKDLPAVGHFSLTGVVNVAGFMEYFVLQNTRLSLVVRMARVMADSIAQASLCHEDARLRTRYCPAGPGGVVGLHPARTEVASAEGRG